MFYNIPLKTKPNQGFLKFLSMQNGDKNNLPNVELLLNMEKDYSGIFAKVMCDYDRAKSYRKILDENGKPKKLSWEEAFRRYSLNHKYLGVTDENKDIAKIFSAVGMTQNLFDYATMLRKEMKEKNIPEHILGKELKEESILESIEKIKNRTKDELINAKEMIEELYEKQFTYEWLNKNDPSNSIIGIFCNCCASIISNCYGKNIVIASILAQDVQNLVVRNLKGDIVSKGTVYVNKDAGYAVINDFELNEEYRKNECDFPGRYRDKKGSNEEKEREMIFKAFQRGLKAFIQEYDKQNPNKPMKKITIGMGFNRLKKQVERFKKETLNLTVPRGYNFKDAMSSEQFILYERVQKEKDDGGFER